MREAEALILSQSARMTLSSPVDQQDTTFLTNQDQNINSYNHPSYRLFDEAMRTKTTAPERAIAMCEKVRRSLCSWSHIQPVYFHIPLTNPIILAGTSLCTEHGQ